MFCFNLSNWNDLSSVFITLWHEILTRRHIRKILAAVVAKKRRVNDIKNQFFAASEPLLKAS